MTDSRSGLVDRFREVLRDFLAEPSEGPRARAYELGAEAANRGLGVLDVAAAHQEATQRLLVDAASHETAAEWVQRSSELLVESLAPFEMTHRGYRETISKLQSANEALRASEARNSALLHGIPDVMLRIASDGTCLDLKLPPGGEAAGLHAEAVGKRLSRILPTPIARRLGACVQRAIQTGEAQMLEYQLPMRGEQRDFEARLIVSGKDEVLAIVRDVTEHKRAEEDRARLIREQVARAEAEAALRLRGEFIAAAAHGLRTPVTTIKGYAGLLRRIPSTETPPFQRALHEMDSSADRIARLAQELIEADELERGVLLLRPRPVDLAELARKAVEQAREEHPGHRFRLEASPTAIEADPERTGEVVRHLLDNAVKYQPGGGDIEVSVTTRAGQAILTVRDHGAGIPGDRRPHVFEPMYEPVPAGSPGYVGVVGLGLAISRRLIERQGGRIWLESAPGRGSAFHFSLPLAAGGNGSSRPDGKS